MTREGQVGQKELEEEEELRVEANMAGRTSLTGSRVVEESSCSDFTARRS